MIEKLRLEMPCSKSRCYSKLIQPQRGSSLQLQEALSPKVTWGTTCAGSSVQSDPHVLTHPEIAFDHESGKHGRRVHLVTV